MIKKLIVVPGALLLSLAFSQASFAHEDQMMTKKHHHHHHSCMHGIMHELNLTSAQKTKINKIREHSRAKLAHNRHELKVVRHEIRMLVASDKMDEGKKNALVHKKQELIGERTKIKIMKRHHIYNVLDAKQKAIWNARIKHCESKHKHH